MRTSYVVLVCCLAALVLLPSSLAADQKKKAEKKNTFDGKGSFVDSFIHDGVTWTIHKDDSKGGKHFYFNTLNKKSTWEDPRTVFAAERSLAVILFAAPFALLILGGGGYVLYIVKFHPEKLKTKKFTKGAKATATKGTADKPDTPVTSDNDTSAKED